MWEGCSRRSAACAEERPPAKAAEETTEESVKTPASPTMMSPMAMDVDEEVVFAKEESPATSEDVVDDPFERMVSEAMKKSAAGANRWHARGKTTARARSAEERVPTETCREIARAIRPTRTPDGVDERARFRSQA